jgi:hypothetical protein
MTTFMTRHNSFILYSTHKIGANNHRVDKQLFIIELCEVFRLQNYVFKYSKSQMLEFFMSFWIDY